MKEFIKFIGDIFIGRQSRKVAFGIWLFWVATSLLVTDKINAPIWSWCALGSGLLIGFGTIADDLVRRFADKFLDVVAKFAEAWGTRKVEASK